MMQDKGRRFLLEFLLMRLIEETGRGIPACRISTARLGSVQWNYWDVVRCNIQISATRPKRLVVKPLESASRQYRSLGKAYREAEARYPDRFLLPPSGLNEESTLRDLLSWALQRYQLSPDLTAAISAQVGPA